MKVIILYLLGSMEPDAVFIGDAQALVACLEVAKTYEVEVACVPAASEAMPYMQAEVPTTRPQPNPFY